MRLLIIVICSLTLLSACKKDFTVKGFSYVEHHKDKRVGEWVEGFDNKAIGLEYKFDKSEYYEQSIGGTLAESNSYGKTGATLHYNGSLCSGYNFRLCTGISAGIIYGYEDQSGMLITPGALWTNKLEIYEGLGVEHNRLPSWFGMTGFDAYYLTYTIELE